MLTNRGRLGLASLATIALGLGASLLAAPVTPDLSRSEATRVRGGQSSGTCNTDIGALYRCSTPSACDDSLANNCNGSCAGACSNTGLYATTFKSGTVRRKTTVDCGNELTGATCAKKKFSNSNEYYCSCDGGTAGAVGACGKKTDAPPCN